MLSNVVGDRVRQARLQRNLSLQQLQQLVLEQSGMNLSQPTLTRIERRERSVYDFELVALVKALEIDARWLLGLIDQEADEQAAGAAQSGAPTTPPG